MLLILELQSRRGITPIRGQEGSRYKQLGTGYCRSTFRLLQVADDCAFLCQRYQRDKDKNTQQALAVKRLWATVEKQVWRGRVWP